MQARLGRKVVRLAAVAWVAGSLALSAVACTLVYSRSEFDPAPADVGPGRDADAGSLDGAATAGGPSDAAIACGLTVAVRHFREPTRGFNLFTVSEAEAAAASGVGYTQDLGIAFYASRGGPLLMPVYCLQNPTTSDRLYTVNASERDAVLQERYTVDLGIAFYAFGRDADCVVPVYGLQHGGVHTLTLDETERDRLVAEGASLEGIRFRVAAP